jgi:hypothetical protein
MLMVILSVTARFSHLYLVSLVSAQLAGGLD